MQTYERGDVCPHCRYIEWTPLKEAVHLMPGTKLRGRYTVGRTLGYGRFGATYIGYDEILQQRVAIKEYMPSEFATRVPGETQVNVLEGDKNEQFYDGMKKFVEEAKRLAKFQNEPGIITIYDAFEENGTAYTVMEYLEGETLASYMEHTGTIPEDTAVMIMTPVMESLIAVHAEGILHRDIAPENIFLTMDGRVKLIDFGASRYATTSHSRSLTVIIKPGYSPEEQYRSRGDQGPYTDVYSAAAVLYKMITGKTPPDALERRAMFENKNKDILFEPHRLNKKISQVRENALMNALNVRIEDRTPDITAFLSELNADEPAKRVYGSIRQMNFFKMPLWMKIAVPAALAAFAVFAVFITAGIIDFSRFSQDIIIPDGVVVVPEVEGLMSGQAISDIEGKRLLAITAGNIESEYIPAGIIVYQTPTGGSYIAMSGKVELMVSSGKVVQEAIAGIATVPYLMWSSLKDAVDKLKVAGLGEPVIEEIYDDNVAAGQIISQSINFGEEVEEGTVLTLQVSRGPEGFEMSDLTGLTEEQAKEKLIELGLSVTVSYVKDDSLPEGKVTKQDIVPGTEVRRGDSIVITAAAKEDTITVADVGGMSKNEAKKVLQDRGFKVTVLGNYSETVEEDHVISQEPQNGTKLKNGDIVTIYVSKGSETAEVETTTRKAAEETTTKAPDATTTKATATTKASETTKAPETTKATAKAPDAATAKAPETTKAAEATTAALPQKYTVTFNGNGGTTPDPIKVTEGKPYGSLPTPTRTGYSFAGWFTAANGGTEVSASDKMGAGNVTVYAHWNVDTYSLIMNANGGLVISGNTYSVTRAFGEEMGALPYAEREYYYFSGWYYEDGSEFLSAHIMPAHDVMIYAHWNEKPVSDWVPANQAPSDAQIAEQKWIYSQTEYTESTNTSMIGWTQYDSEWRQTGSGSANYSIQFPGGFDTSHWIYTSFYKGVPYAASETATSKRTVSDEWGGYVYWHWMYDTGNADGTSKRAIYNKKGTASLNNFYYMYFGAWTSTMSYTDGGTDYCCSLGIRNYIRSDLTAWSDCQGATRWFRFEYRVCTYTDYTKVFKYMRTVDGLESAVEAANGGNISNVRKFVRYREK